MNEEKKLYVFAIIITIIIFGIIYVTVVSKLEREFKLCYPNEENDWWGQGTYIYNSVDNTHYNCCQYKTILNDDGYYEETKVCKGFTKHPT